jgi:hypothetical protein
MTFSVENAGKAQPAPRRGYISRMALFWSVITAGCAALVVLALVNIVSGNTGYIVMLSVFGLVGFLTGYWMLAYVRDLKAEPITVEGEVARKWVRGQILEFFMQACYISVEGKIFVIKRSDYAGLLETDLVRVQCYPHSLTVIHIERYDEVDKRFIPADGGDPVQA